MAYLISFYDLSSKIAQPEPVESLTKKKKIFTYPNICQGSYLQHSAELPAESCLRGRDRNMHPSAAESASGKTSTCATYERRE